MTHQSQKEEEEFYLCAFIDCLGIGDRVENVQSSEAPDFTFDFESRKIGVELTGYHSSQYVNAGGTRRRLEAEWEYLQDGLRERPEDLEGGLFVGLYFRELRIPQRPQYEEFKKQLHEALREQLSIVGGERSLFEPDTPRYPLLSEFVKRVTVKRIDAWADWESNLNVGSVGTTEDELIELVKGKLNQGRPSGVSELWLLVHGGWRISEMMGWVFVEQLSSYARLGEMLERSPFDLVYLYEWAEDRIISWRRGQGWTVEVGTLYP